MNYAIKLLESHLQLMQDARKCWTKEAKTKYPESFKKLSTDLEDIKEALAKLGKEVAA